MVVKVHYLITKDTNMPITLIEQNPKFDKKVADHDDKLAIAEMFGKTIQGEGVSAGVLSVFLRVQGCTLKCTYCDTLTVWPNGNEYSFAEIFALLDRNGIIEDLKNGHHLILTGGSPLKQQKQLINFIETFIAVYKFKPFIEVENEAVLMPDAELVKHVDQWNNSPKLDNSGMKQRVRIKPLVLSYMGSLSNSWFKFVVKSEEDWQEIQDTFITPGFIKKSQVILMPEGQTQQELSKTREIAADMAIKYGVRFTDRLHITIWDKKTGV